jgi:PHD/YefM family antitoxin component YafN of YafNO toxin-antitoxin module
MLSLSLGRKDYYPEDNYAFASSTKDTLVLASKKKGTFKLLSRDAFIEEQLTTEDKKKLKSLIKADASRRTRKKKRKGGFQKGNTCSKTPKSS